MDKVFTRWPSPVESSAERGPATSQTALPAWMQARRINPWPEWCRSIATAVGLIVLPAGLAFVTGVLFSRSGLIAVAFGIVTAASLMIAGAYAMERRRAFLRIGVRCQEIFEKASVSMWVEDWSSVGSKVAALRRRGVLDLEGYFATRPDELRALLSSVTIKDCNAFAVEEAGAPDKASLMGSLDTMLPHTDQTFVQWLVAFARGDRFFRSEAHITSPDGTQKDTLFTAALPQDAEGFANLTVTSFDITGYKREQAKLLAADAEIARVSRISTVGALSASIAHEVNSPLAAVVANAQAALRWLNRPIPDVAEATEAVSAVIVDATRAKEVVARTRAFVSNTALSIAPFDVVVAAREAVLLVERQLRSSGAAVHLKVEKELPFAIGDVIQVQQVFTNLLLNAAHAMEALDGAREVTLKFARMNKNIQVEVADTGSGIDPRQLERIFDPSFTTKPGGIGLGLAICRNCIDAQGGNIWASNNPNGGSIFHFTLPIHNS